MYHLPVFVTWNILQVLKDLGMPIKAEPNQYGRLLVVFTINFSCVKNLENDKKNHISENLEFLKSKNSLQDIELNQRYDIIYFDAFAPSKQPSMWEKKNLEKIYSNMKHNSVLVTYCSSGQFKRDLKSIGVNVNILPGPKGKKEMIRAIK